MFLDFEGEIELVCFIAAVSVIPVTPIISVESGSTARRPIFRVPLSVEGRLFLGSSVLLLEATSNFVTSPDVIANFAPVALALLKP